MTTPATAPSPAVSPYAFPVRALRRWAGENLTLTPRPDGGLEALFRLEGSTCANIAFSLLYRVTLSPAPAGRRIEAMNCAPAPYDEGHTRMCSWQENAGAIAATMRDETPLLGLPLDAVLAWRPNKSPAGCLCAQPSRHYKWQAVLETLHFALHQPPASPSS
jgi:hypothetical protein